ncbi:MAG TPA: OmpA family protein [Cytophagaceae bacterium]|nr:OmpA family protein [Cytophagaceae bacterium]
MLIKINLFCFFILLTGIVIGQNLKTDSLPVNLGKNINSKNAEIAPVISPDGKTLYFSRDYYHKEIEKTFRRTYHMIMVEYQTIFSSQLDTANNWRSAKKMKDEMNGSEFNALCSISPDGNNILLYKFPKLYITHRNGSDWGALIEQKMDNFYDSSSFCNFYLSNDGKYLISSVTRQQHRKEDIFVSFLIEENHWSAPKNLGSAINSHGREISPFLAADNRTLYFSSDRWEGFGEMDIYVSHRHDSSWTDWSPPKNLGYSINSIGWDAYLSVPASGNAAYFVSTQSGFGQEDIFKVILPLWARPHRLVEFKGKVLDDKTKLPVKAKISYSQSNEELESGETYSDSIAGTFRLLLHARDKYEFTLAANNYVCSVSSFSIDSSGQEEKIFYMNKIRKPLPHPFHAVYFNKNSCDLMPDGEVELQRLAGLLNDQPTLKIELAGHTDNLGDEKYNLKLSKKRVKTVRDYLISKGIYKSRIIIKAYGEDRPVAANDYSEGQQLNRRVEYDIISNDK